MTETGRHVKGTFFTEYVRMLRANADFKRENYLLPEDLPYLEQTIDPSAWYPMDTFERLGLAIFVEIAGNNLEAVRLWGRASVDTLHEANQLMVCEGDPRESLVRFQVVRASYFDFDAVDFLVIYDNSAKLTVNYGMSDKAEEAATWQTVGYFERLLELAGSTNVSSRIKHRRWEGASESIIEFQWSNAPPAYKVRGSILVQYVKMIRTQKTVDWGAHLNDRDLDIVFSTIDEKEWYPMDTFERVAAGVFREVAEYDLTAVRVYGRRDVDRLFEENAGLLCEDDPRESLSRMEVLNRGFFNFSAMEVKSVSEKAAEVKLAFNMTREAEKVVVYQFLGYLERMLELCGAKSIENRFLARTWEGDEETVIGFEWSDVPESEHVKGALFLEYVKMLKAKKDIDWRKYLSARDMEYLKATIIATDWYPMETLGRMAEGIYREIADSDTGNVRKWGRYMMEDLFSINPELLAPGEPTESLMRFQTLRQGFFDFEPVIIQTVTEGHARMKVSFGMSRIAEEAATMQVLGFLERIIEASGAKDVTHNFVEKAWKSGSFTLLELSWSK